MNKTKVIELATNLVSDTYSALMLRDQSMFESCKNREKEIIEEAGSIQHVAAPNYYLIKSFIK